MCCMTIPFCAEKVDDIVYITLLVYDSFYFELKGVKLLTVFDVISSPGALKIV